MRKWPWRMALTICLIAAIGAALYFLRPTDPVSEENFERIQIGMTEDDVEAILGRPLPESIWIEVKSNLLDFGLVGKSRFKSISCMAG